MPFLHTSLSQQTVLFHAKNSSHFTESTFAQRVVQVLWRKLLRKQRQVVSFKTILVIFQLFLKYKIHLLY